MRFITVNDSQGGITFLYERASRRGHDAMRHSAKRIYAFNITYGLACANDAHLAVRENCNATVIQL